MSIKIIMGKALYRAGEYDQAIEYFQNAFDTENYALAFKEIRAQVMADWFVLVVVGIVAAFIILVKAF